MTRLLRTTGEWCDGTDGKDYLVNTNYELAWALSEDNILHCNRLNVYYETQGMAVALTQNNTFKIMATGVELIPYEYYGYNESNRSVMSRLSRMLLSR